MSLNRFPAKQIPFAINSSRCGSKSRWIALLPILVLSLGLGGCALNSTGLPGTLPVPPGGGTLTISRTTLVNGIIGRTYTIWIPTSGGTGTLAPGGCTLISGVLPTGLSIAPSDDLPTTAALSFCKITGTITAGGGTTINFTVQAADTATPANTASQAFSITVRNDFAVTTATPFLDGVVGRTYGNPAAPDLKAPQPVVTSVSATVGNAPISACLFSGTAITGNPAFVTAPAATPAGPTATTCNLGTAAATLTTAGALSVTLAATDSDLMDTFVGQTTKVVVPKATKTSAALALTVRAALALALTQTGNATPATALFNAVSGRRYGTAAQAAGAPTYAATGGLIAGSTYNWCISTGALPAGFAAGPTALAACPTTASIAVATSETVTAVTAGAAGGPTAFTLQVADVANAAVSSGAATAATALTINPVLSLAANFNNPVPDAVFGRTWGGVGFTSLIYTGAGGDGAYTFTAPPTAGAPVAGSFPTPMACAPAATTLTCSSAAITGTAGAYTNAPASVDDAGNGAVPGSASVAATATVTRSLTVRSEFTITTVTPFINGVNGRTYGNPAPPDLKTPQPVVTDVSATVGNAPLTVCAFTVLAANPGFILAPAPTGGNTCNLSSGPATLTAAGAFTVALAATDSPIIDPVSTGAVVPAKTISNAGAPLPITVDPAMTLTLTQAGNATPNTALLLGVESRSYGLVGGTPTYVGSGGLGTSVNYDWCVTGALPAGFVTTPPIPACATTVLLPVAASVTVTSPSAGAAGGPTPFTLQIGDGSNAAVVAGTASSATALTVAPPISFSLVPAPTGVAPAGVIPDGVVGRTYGTPLANLVFTATGGLANAAGIGLQGTQTGTLSANGINCNPTTPQVGVSVTVTCNSGGGPVTTPSGAGRTLIMTFSDAGSTAVPAGSTSTDTAGYTAYSNSIADVLAIALQAGSPDPTNVNAQAVVGRTYGAAPQSPVVYQATNGLLAYVFVRSNTLLANSNICGTQIATATTLTCDSGGAAVTGTTGDLTVTVNDTGTVTTPSGSAAITQTYTVNPAVTLTVSPDPSFATATAVNGRFYGVPAGLLSPTYTAANGLGLYTFIHSATVGGANTNIACTDTATTVKCERGAPGVIAVGPFPEVEAFSVQVQDGANLTTPADLVGATVNSNFTINDELVITTASVPNALQDYTYFPTGPGVTLTATGGLGGNTWVPGGTTNLPCSPTASTVFPPGLSLTSQLNDTGLISGVATVQSPTPADYTFEVCVFDTQNTTTPSGTPAALPSYTLNVVGHYAAAAGTGTDSLEVIDTGNSTTPVFNTSVTDPAWVGGAPAAVAVRPDGRKAYVTLPNIDSLGEVDTLDGTVTTISLNPGGPLNCTGPQGIATGLPGAIPVPTAFIACSNGRIAVVDISTSPPNLLSTTSYGSGGSFYGVAMNTPTDTLVYVTDSTNHEVVVLDAASGLEVTGSPFAAGVTTPHGIVINALGTRAYIAGNVSDDIIVKDATLPSNTFPTLAGPIPTGLGSAPESLAVTPSDAPVEHVYATLIGKDEFVVIDDLSMSVTPARAIDPTANVGAVRSANVVTITTTAAHGFSPGQDVVVSGVADSSFNGSFTVLLTPTATTFTYAQVAANATSQGGAAGPIESLSPATSPWGVTIPPLLLVPPGTATSVRVFIGQFSTSNVAIRDDETTTPFGVNGASPIALTLLPSPSTPTGMAHIPVPR